MLTLSPNCFSRASFTWSEINTPAAASSSVVDNANPTVQMHTHPLSSTINWRIYAPCSSNMSRIVHIHACKEKAGQFLRVKAVSEELTVHDEKTSEGVFFRKYWNISKTIFIGCPRKNTHYSEYLLLKLLGYDFAERVVHVPSESIQLFNHAIPAKNYSKIFAWYLWMSLRNIRSFRCLKQNYCISIKISWRFPQ